VVIHRYVVVPTGDLRERWRVSSREYSYELTTKDNRTFVRWDWHPDSAESPVTWPYLHLRGRTEPVDLTHGIYSPAR